MNPDPARRAADQKKKQYKKPRISSEELHERTALACGKDDPGVPNCLTDPQNS